MTTADEMRKLAAKMKPRVREDKQRKLDTYRDNLVYSCYGSIQRRIKFASKHGRTWTNENYTLCTDCHCEVWRRDAMRTVRDRLVNDGFRVILGAFHYQDRNWSVRFSVSWT